VAGFNKPSAAVKKPACGRFASFSTFFQKAEQIISQDGDLFVIQDLLGHATPRTMANYYIHPAEQKLRAAVLFQNNEKLPAVIYLNQLVKAGLLKFQANYYQRN
jgi:hypothetical protein